VIPTIVTNGIYSVAHSALPQFNIVTGTADGPFKDGDDAYTVAVAGTEPGGGRADAAVSFTLDQNAPNLSIVTPAVNSTSTQ
jgi:hypothetical protein